MSSELKGLSRTEPELRTLFGSLESERGTQDQQWEDYAGWTLPVLYPRDDSTTSLEAQHDFQSLGAQAVNHLSNKIVMTLFAPARPFFRLELTPEQSKALQEAGVPADQIEKLTGKVENEAMRLMEKVHLRTSVITAVKNLVVLGNTLLYAPKKGLTQVYNLRDYVVKRDMGGEVLQIVMRDRRAVATLPEELKLRALVDGRDEDDFVDLYTGVVRSAEDRFFVKQEMEDLSIVEDSFGTYPENELPWLPLTWNLLRGQDYGSSLVEDYAGDFQVYSSLSEANLNIAALAADIKILVNPMAEMDLDTLNEAPSGTYVAGRIEDISYLQLEKLTDFSFVNNMMEIYSRRIGQGFLLNTAVTRDAERVTAEEIRLQANELESSLGGVYSRLAEEMQQPLARQLIRQLDSQLAKIEPVILTGVESLSRNSEHEQIMGYLNDLTILNNVPEMMLADLKLPAVAQMLATNRGLDTDVFMKSAEEKQAEQQAAQQQAAQSQLMQSAAESVGGQAGQPPMS